MSPAQHAPDGSCLDPSAHCHSLFQCHYSALWVQLPPHNRQPSALTCPAIDTPSSSHPALPGSTAALVDSMIHQVTCKPMAGYGCGVKAAAMADCKDCQVACATHLLLIALWTCCLPPVLPQAPAQAIKIHHL
jgi:hypothetical protein